MKMGVRKRCIACNREGDLGLHGRSAFCEACLFDWDSGVISEDEWATHLYRLEREYERGGSLWDRLTRARRGKT